MKYTIQERVASKNVPTTEHRTVFRGVKSTPPFPSGCTGVVTIGLTRTPPNHEVKVKMLEHAAPPNAPRVPWFLYALVALTMTAIGWFYLWTVSPAHNQFMGEQARSSYYNLLVAGMLKGQLSLDVPDDPVLAASDDPYNPANRVGRGMHDASYFKGRFYIYFGVTPVLILFLPFRLLTGTYLAENFAVALFAFTGLVFAWALLRAIIRRYFPATPVWIQLLSLVCLGLGNMIPPLLRRPHMWEVTIACAYALFMLTLWLVWQALHRARPGRWLGAASLTMGLAIGARPVYLLAAVVLLIPLVEHVLNQGRSFVRTASFRRLALATLGPISAVGFGLCLYNYLRFESPFEFGQAYQLSGAEEGKLDHFSLRYVPFNLQVYLFSVPGLSWYFPFLTTISPPPVPSGQFGIENPYGMLPGMPWVLFALATIAFAFRRRDSLGHWCLSVALAALLTMSLIFCFGGTTGRYQVDFTPGIVLLAGVGVSWWLGLTSHRIFRGAILTAATALAVWSASFNVLISLQHNRLLQQEHPALYARVATRFNHLSHWMAKSGERVYGPVKMSVTFPEELTENVEALVATGREFLSDFVYVQKLGNRQIRFGFEHTSRGGFKGEPVTIVPGQEYTLVVQMGSLHPPLEHPVYAGMPKDQITGRTQYVQVTLDGRTVLSGKVEFYDSSGSFSVGTVGPNRPKLMANFSGRVLGWSLVDPIPIDPAPAVSGRLYLSITLPAFSGPRVLPLLSTGIRGQGDVVYIRQITAETFSIGHDHWGGGGDEGTPQSYIAGARIELEIFNPAVTGQSESELITVKRDQTIVLHSSRAVHPSTFADVAIGWNKIGSNLPEIEFNGELWAKEWIDLDAPETYPISPILRLQFMLPAFTRAQGYPLVSSGKTGAGNLIFLRHIDANHFLVGHDFWGGGGTIGDPIEFDPSLPFDLEITYPPAAPLDPDRPLVIKWNDRVILEGRDPFYPSRPHEIVVGRNKIGASNSEREFGPGLSSEWLRP